LNPYVFPKEKENAASIYHTRMHEDKFSVLICPTAVMFTVIAEVRLGWANVERLRCSLVYINGYEELYFLFKNSHTCPEKNI